MDKNLVISIVIVVAFVVGVYLVVKNAKTKEPEITTPESEVVVQENQSNVSSEKVTDFSMVKVKEGTGDVVTKPGDVVAVRYAGYLQDGTVFDSNISDGDTDFEFKIGEGSVIKGWEIGLLGMKVGEVRKLTIPPQFAYGDKAVGPIPANSTIIFEVELKAIK